MRRLRVRKFQPSMIRVSAIWPSPKVFLIDSSSSRGSGSCVATGRPIMCRARGTAAAHRSALFPMSTHTGGRSSRYTSTMPLSLSGRVTAIGLAAANGSSESSRNGAGNRCCIGDRRVSGSQASHWIRSFAKSPRISEWALHRFGNGLPPKVNRREAYNRSSKMVRHSAIEVPDKWALLYAALRSYLPNKILLSGCFAL